MSTNFEIKQKKSVKQKVVLFGCLPISILVAILIVVGIFTNGTKLDYTGETMDVKREINNFCLMSINELKQKYGIPLESEYEGNKDYTWILNKKEGIKVLVFTEKNKELPVAVRFVKIDLGTYFWDKLDWNKNNLDFNKAGGYTTISNLNGIEKAMYKHNTLTLNVDLKENRTPKGFGK